MGDLAINLEAKVRAVKERSGVMEAMHFASEIIRRLVEIFCKTSGKTQERAGKAVSVAKRIYNKILDERTQN